MTQCRAMCQAGDGLRMSNLEPLLQRFYRSLTVALLQKDPENPDVDKVGRGTYPVIRANLERFTSVPERGEE